jgi:hypothetical protein
MVISKKPVISVLIEAVVVGLFLILFIEFSKKLIMPLISSQDSGDLLKDLQLYFIAGFLFHITCEYTGINLWYANKYCSL